jgi:hypothetical protein
MTKQNLAAVALTGVASAALAIAVACSNGPQLPTSANVGPSSRPIGPSGVPVGPSSRPIGPTAPSPRPSSTPTPGSTPGPTPTPSPGGGSLQVTGVVAASGRAYLVCNTATDNTCVSKVFADDDWGLVGSGFNRGIYIRGYNVDKNATQDPFLTFTVNRPVIIQVLYSAETSPCQPPAWLSAYGNSGLYDLSSPSRGTTHRVSNNIYRVPGLPDSAPAPAGTYTLGPPEDAGCSDPNRVMYIAWLLEGIV